jgi:hypothetical protein
MSRAAVLLHRQLSPEDLQQLLVWYKIRDTLFGVNGCEKATKKALELASVCEHPSAVWLTKLFAGRDVASGEDARQVFLAFENDPRALCFAAFLVDDFDEVGRAAELGDAFAQAWMTQTTIGQESFRWAEKCAAQGERDGFYNLGRCYRDGIECDEDVERAKESFLVAAELGYVYAMVFAGWLFDRDDPLRFFWLGRAASNGESGSFLNEMAYQIRRFNFETGLESVVFAIGRALQGHIDGKRRTIFGNSNSFDTYIDSANQALHFYEFRSQSYRKAVDMWTIIGLRNNVVKDIRNMIGKKIWDARDEAAFVEEK